MPVRRMAALAADPTRAEILTTLMDGRAHTGGELARHVGVAPSTASEHPARLVDGDLIIVEARGRHRYFPLADANVAALLEALSSTLMGGGPITKPRAQHTLAFARTCYDHLAGSLAVRFYQRLTDTGAIALRDHIPTITRQGAATLAVLDFDVAELQVHPRPLVKHCLDWTERRPHLAGASGAEFLHMMLAQRWLTRTGYARGLRLTTKRRT